jgi:hypothetical protein
MVRGVDRTLTARRAVLAHLPITRQGPVPGQMGWFCRNNLFQSCIYCAWLSGMEPQMFKGRHFDRSVILLCIRWYLAYNLSLKKSRGDDGRTRHLR